MVVQSTQSQSGHQGETATTTHATTHPAAISVADAAPM